MKIFKIEFHKVDWDQYDSFVVIANNHVEVIDLIKNKYPDSEWREVDFSGGYKISEIKLDDIKEPTIILGSFNAG